jgi:hypothetical protein
MQETELEQFLAPYGTVISTRILRDGNHQPRGVGFARMDSKDKCDIIIATLNGKALVGCKEPLLVKFADGGNKKKPMNRSWRDNGDQMHMHNDQSMGQNGVNPGQLIPSSMAAAAAQYGQAARQFSAPTGIPTASYPQAAAAAAAAAGFQARQYSNAAAAAAAAAQMPSSYPTTAGYQGRPYSGTSIQASSYPGAAAAAAALQSAASHPWVPPPQYHLVQAPASHMQPPQMIPSQAMALHLSALMPQLSAQMSQLQLGGNPVSFLKMAMLAFANYFLSYSIIPMHMSEDHTQLVHQLFTLHKELLSYNRFDL